jgi:hypothetical protein
LFFIIIFFTVFRFLRVFFGQSLYLRKLIITFPPDKMLDWLLFVDPSQQQTQTKHFRSDKTKHDENRRNIKRRNRPDSHCYNQPVSSSVLSLNRFWAYIYILKCYIFLTLYVSTQRVLFTDM